MSDRNDDPLSPDEAATLVVAMTLTALNGTFRAHRDLLADARTSGSRDRPTHLKRLGEDIPSDERQAIEKVAGKVGAGVRQGIADLFTAPAAPVDNGQPTYPFALEHLAVYAIAARGRAQMDADLAPLVRACGDDTYRFRYALAYLQWTFEDPPAARLGKALLPAVVADFEELLAALVRLWLTRDPSALGVAVEVPTSDDPAEVRAGEARNREKVDKRVKSFVNDGPVVWERVLDEKLGISLPSLSPVWPRVVEVLARRNTVIHAGGRVDGAYLRQARLEGAQPAPGTVLSFDAAYVTDALEAFERLGQLLAVELLFRLTRENASAVDCAEDQVFQALDAERWDEARRMALTAMEHCPASHDVHELQVNYWMARRELRDDWDVLVSVVEAWEPPDDSPRYALAKAALLGDERTALLAVERCEKEGLRMRGIAHWPLAVQMGRTSPSLKKAVDLAVARQARPSSRGTRRRGR